jgi:peptidoglycan/LPS O-acetylase OafA/YrhL
MKQERFGELDALRGLAALAVVIYHYTGHAARYFGDFPWKLEIGRYGVQLFFCISGFVIFWTLQRSKTVGDFAFSRFTRLYPAYWATLALWLVVSVVLLGRPLWVGGYAANVTMLQTFFGVEDIDLVFWTLAIELAFYVWMAAFFVLGILSRMVLVAYMWLGLSAATAIAERFVPMPKWIDTYFIFSAIPFFMAGVMFYLISREGWKRAYMAVIGCALVVAGLRGWTGFVVAAVVFGVFALAIGGRLRWIVNPVSAWLGAISYTLYLTHRNLGYEILFALNRKGWPSWASILLTIAAAFAVASLITYAIERPAMRVLRDWRKRGYQRWRIARCSMTQP